MRRLRILGNNLTSEDLAAVKDLMLEAGFAAEEVDAILEVAVPLPHCEDELLIIMLSAKVCEDPDLERELIKSHDGGTRRTICIWPRDLETQPTMPEVVGKYAYSIIPWNADKLRAVAADDDTLCFETPSGEPLPKVLVERNLCVDEDEK